MGNEKVLQMAKELLNEVDAAKILTIDVVHVQESDGSTAFSIEVEFPPTAAKVAELEQDEEYYS